MTAPDDEPGPSASQGTDSPGVADLVHAILGEAPSLSAQDITDATGIAPDRARRLWRALGFPTVDDQNAYTQADLEAVRLIARIVGETEIDFETVLRLTRAVGTTTARLADWEVATLSSAVEGFGDNAVTPETMRHALAMVEEITPHFDTLLAYAWRRHLAAAVNRIEMVGDDARDQHVAQATVGFADLVAFTQLSNELDEHELGELVELFETRCSEVVAERGGRVIKTLGDSVLFLEGDPVTAIDIGLDIIAVVGRDDRMPDVRVGLASGPVVLRMGDVYGPPVNLAARLTAVARRNRVIIDAHTAGLLPPAEFATRRMPARPMRGFGDVEPVTVLRTRPRHR